MISDSQLSDVIGYHFQNADLLKIALTHRSFGSLNNERLEFLGDSLLNMIIAEALFRQFEQLREGELSRMRARLVKGETLALLAEEFALGDALRLGSGEKQTGGHRRSSILADAVEAIIGAIYLDAGFETCRRIVLTWYGPRLRQLEPGVSHKDAKTRLQEWLQSRKQALPTYELMEVRGEEHQQEFIVACHIEPLSLPEQASGSSRRKAEQAAAEKVLQKLQCEDPSL